MKKRFLLFALIAFIFVKCSSDSGSSINEEDLLGKWYLQGEKHNDGPFVLYQHACSASKDYQEFLIPHNIQFVGYGTDCAVNDSQTSAWTLEGNRLKIISFDPAIINPDIFVITKLTDEELNLK